MTSDRVDLAQPIEDEVVNSAEAIAAPAVDRTRVSPAVELGHRDATTATQVISEDGGDSSARILDDISTQVSSPANNCDPMEHRFVDEAVPEHPSDVPLTDIANGMPTRDSHIHQFIANVLSGANPCSFTMQPDVHSRAATSPASIEMSQAALQLMNDRNSNGTPAAVGAPPLHTAFYDMKDRAGRWLPPGGFRKTHQGRDTYAWFDEIGTEHISDDTPTENSEESNLDAFGQELPEGWWSMRTTDEKMYYIVPRDQRNCGRTWHSPLGPDQRRLLAQAKILAFTEHGASNVLRRETETAWVVSLRDIRVFRGMNLRELASLLTTMELSSTHQGRLTPDSFSYTRARRFLPALQDGFVDLDAFPRLCFITDLMCTVPKTCLYDTASRNFSDIMHELGAMREGAQSTSIIWIDNSRHKDGSFAAALLRNLAAVILLGLDCAKLNRVGQIFDFGEEALRSLDVWCEAMMLSSFGSSLVICRPAVRYGQRYIVASTNMRPLSRWCPSFPWFTKRYVATDTALVYLLAWAWLRSHWWSIRQRRGQLLASWNAEGSEHTKEAWAYLWNATIDLKLMDMSVKEWVGPTPYSDTARHLQLVQEQEELHQVVVENTAIDASEQFRYAKKLYDELCDGALVEAELWNEKLEVHRKRQSHRAAQESLEATKQSLEATKQNLRAAEKSLEASQLSIQEAHMVSRITLLAYIFLPITLVTGIFGMNIEPWAGESGAPLWTFAIVTPCIVVPAWLFGFYTIRRATLRELRVKWINIWGAMTKEYKPMTKRKVEELRGRWREEDNRVIRLGSS